VLVHVERTHGPMARLLYGVLLTRRGRLTAVTNARLRGGHARHTAGTEYAIVCFAGDEWMGPADCSVIGKAGLAERNSVQPIFLKETRGKEASACRGGGQQVAENGGNERAVPTFRKQPCTPAWTLRLASCAPGCYSYPTGLSCFRNFHVHDLRRLTVVNTRLKEGELSL
jgi:hypothetical protein